MPPEHCRPVRPAFQRAVGQISDMLAPGGLLDSQTSDSQFIASLCKSANHATIPEDVSSAAPALRHNPYSRVRAALQTQQLNCRPAPGEFPADDAVWEPWRLYDEVINGPKYAGGRDWRTLSILARFDAFNSRFNQRFIFAYATPGLVEFTQDHLRELYALTGNTASPPNNLQGELAFQTTQLYRVQLNILNAIPRADVARVREMVNVGRYVLDAVETLLDVDREARDEVNRRYGWGSTNRPKQSSEGVHTG
ncbi:hypothetical protein BV22DRAFT_1132837 [Leucogyrophana mollusca]|uniref:Uncharacterized protein n=1 Tax=Leucogyrophana mollusca TaxID=85980 RepID=A0ACB8B5S6_9AGAM|nr:hypothetical protein BV22DRAFT_1132837 [Leucogyrophana mollusca]